MYGLVTFLINQKLQSLLEPISYMAIIKKVSSPSKMYKANLTWRAPIFSTIIYAN